MIADCTVLSLINNATRCGAGLQAAMLNVLYAPTSARITSAMASGPPTLPGNTT
jgi:hypothetical protein